MRHLGSSIVSLWAAAAVTGLAATAQQGAAAKPPAIRACQLLTKDLALKVTAAANKKIFDILPPEEESLGATGSACEYGDIRLQIDPFTARRFEELSTKEKGWTPEPNLGDKASFRTNPNGYAELFVAVGTHVMTIQISVPTGGTAAGIKPNAIALAKELMPKLR
ncbi:MAG TPA: hypothetical protein VFO19_08635 [Vicinamibacterales bacterium]|nr:hypothetical protein [Vicinamibacterales bacterium]